MNFIADLYRGAIRQQHPHGDLQPFSASIDDRDRAISPLGPAEDLKSRTIKRMERIENLDLVALREQGIVGADVFIRTSTAWLPLAASPPTTQAGSPPDALSFCPSACSAVSSAASSSPHFATPSIVVSFSSTATFSHLLNHAPSLSGYGYCSATTGSSTPSRPSADRNMCCVISAPILIASPFRTPGWLLSPMATSPSDGATPRMATRSGS